MVDKYPVIDMRATGKWLRYICKRKGISVATMQRDLGLSSNQAIYAWFNGKSLPNLDNYCALGKLLQISLDNMIVFCECEYPFF